MSDYDLKLGERLEILRDERRGISDIQQITPEGRLVISEPLCGSGYLPVKQNDILKLVYYRAFGMLTCTITVERVFEENGLKLIEIELRSQISRYQRRDFVRFETVLPISVKPLFSAQEIKDLPDAKVISMLIDRRLSGDIETKEELGGFTMDISGGGVRFICKKPLEVGSLAECVVYLNDDNIVTFDTRIVRSERDLDDGDKFLSGAKFVGIGEVLRNRIIKYIFSEQLKRKRELSRV